MERTLPLLAVHLDSELAQGYHRKIVKFGAEFLHGYPSVISEFASCPAARNLSLSGLKAVFTTAEMLLPRYRRTIERKLRCQVWDNYGSNDGSILSWECARHHGLHYSDLESVIESLDPGPDSVGSLAVTNLWNRSLPFVRYESGDLVSLSDTSCPCGQPFPLLESVVGRTADTLRFGNGRSLSGPALTLVFRDMDIDAWQVVQTDPNRVEVLVKSASQLPARSANHIHAVLGMHVGAGVDVAIREVDSLRATAAGKWKPIWSRGKRPSERGSCQDGLEIGASADSRHPARASFRPPSQSGTSTPVSRF